MFRTQQVRWEQRGVLGVQKELWEHRGALGAQEVRNLVVGVVKSVKKHKLPLEGVEDWKLMWHLPQNFYHLYCELECVWESWKPIFLDFVKLGGLFGEVRYKAKSMRHTRLDLCGGCIISN